jgi:hypothetical protein
VKYLHAIIIIYIMTGEAVVAGVGFVLWNWTPGIVRFLFCYSALAMIAVYWLLHRAYLKINN